MAETAERPLEREIYKTLWDRDEYRIVAPGEACVEEFLRQAKPRPGSAVIDLGCGTGRAGLLLAILGQLDVTMLDFAPNCLDADIVPMLETQKHTLRFSEADLTQPLPVVAPYGFCTDVLEHIPPEQLDAVLDNCLRACQHCYFQIATTPDVMGELVGHPLHLSVHPYSWWLRRFGERECVIHWSRNYAGISGTKLGRCAFYVTAWADGQDLVDVGVLNIEEEQVLANVRYNIAQRWQAAAPHETNNIEVAILGGGPSLAKSEKQIRRMHSKGVKLVTLNGAYNWCMERGIGPVTQVVVDARPFNARFTHPVDERCIYLIASQCDPSVFEGLPRARTYIWHTSAAFIRDVLNEQYEDWWGIPGGSTVLLRAIPLLRTLGYKRFHLFGCDSCLQEGVHHAYAQAENEEELVVPVTVGNRIFHCYPWMASQAQEFMALIQHFGDEIDLQIHGDGLLAHILKTGADMELEKEKKRL